MRKKKRMLALLTVFALMIGIFTQYGTWVGATENVDTQTSDTKQEQTSGENGEDTAQADAQSEGSEEGAQGEEKSAEDAGQGTAEGENGENSAENPDSNASDQSGETKTDGTQSDEDSDLIKDAKFAAGAKRPDGNGPVELTTTLSPGLSGEPNVNAKLDSIVITASTGNWDPHPYKGGTWSSTGKFSKYREIKFSYTWDIPHPQNYQVGDYFLLPLSQSDIIEYKGQVGKIMGMKDGSTQKIVVGSYSVIELPDRYGTTLEYAKIELNQEAVDATRVRDGEFFISGRVSRDAAINTPFVMYGPEQKMFELTAGAKIHKTLNNIGLYKSEDRPNLIKNSGKAGDGSIEWSLEVNRDNLQRMFKGQAPVVRKNLYMEDELPRGTKLQAKRKIYIIPMLYVPFGGNENEVKDPNGERIIGNATIDWFRRGYEDHFNGLRPEYDKQYGEERITAIGKFRGPHFDREVLQPNSGEEYDAFKARVLAAKQAGVFPNSDGSQKLVIYIGDDPMDMTYYNWFNASLNDNSSEHFNKYIDAHANAGRANVGDVSEVGFMNDLQVKEMKEIYGSSGSTQGRITGLRVSYRTDIVNKELEGGFYNSASLWEGNTKVSSSERYQFYASSGGSANLEEALILNKKWESNDQNWIDKQTLKFNVTPIGMETGKEYTVAKQEITMKKPSGASTKVWTLIAKDMVRFINGEEVEYKVEEVVPSNAQYQLKEIVKGAKKNEWIITNTKKGEAPVAPTINVNVTMVDCADDVNKPAAPNKDVNLILERHVAGGAAEIVKGLDNKPLVKTIKANAKGDGARVTFIGVDKVDSSNNVYIYTVKQVELNSNGEVANDMIVPGYKPPVIVSQVETSTGNYDVKVQNCKEIKKVKFDVTLVNCKEEAMSPDRGVSIRLERAKAGTDQWSEVQTHVVSANTDASPTLSFQVDQNDQNGEKYIYRVLQLTDLTGVGYKPVEYLNETPDSNGNYSVKIKNCKIETINFVVQLADCEKNPAKSPIDMKFELQRKLHGADDSTFAPVQGPGNTVISYEVLAGSTSANDMAGKIVFNNLPKYDAADKVYVYRVVAKTPNAQYQILGHETAIDSATGNQGMMVQICKNIDVRVNLVDCEKNPKVPEAGATLTLQRRAEGESTFTDVKNGAEVIKKELTSSDPATATFENLPKLDPTTGKKYEYKVMQSSLGENYSTINKDIANTANNYEVTIVNCKKIDVRVMVYNCKDEPTAPPVNITFTLQAKLENQNDDQFADVMKDHKVVEATMFSTTTIPTLSFNALPKFDPLTGLRYVYRVVETPSKIDGYTMANSGYATAENHYNINVKICKEEFVNVNVLKKWTGAYETPTKEVEFTLQRRKASETQFKDVLDSSNSPVKAKILQGASEQSAKFIGLPKFDYSAKKSDGTYESYVYQVVEAPLSGYSTTYDVKVEANGDYTITVTNDRPNAIGGITEPSGDSSDDSGSNEGSGTVSHVERITTPNSNVDPKKPSGNDPKSPNTSSDNGNSNVNVGNHNNSNAGNQPETKIVEGTQVGGPDTQVLPGVIPKKDSSATGNTTKSSVNPSHAGRLPKTGEGLNIETYALILLLCGISLVSYGLYRKKKKEINHKEEQ